MSMTIQLSVKDKILATSSETSKVENAPIEMLRDLDQQMEKRADDGYTLWIKLYSKYEYEIRYHPGKANVVIDALRRKERVKPRRAFKKENVLTERLYGLDCHMEKKEDESLYFMDRIYVMLAGNDENGNAAESVRDAIGFEYCLASSSGWTNYHSSIWCAPFEALYGRKCRSPVLWAEIGESSLIGPELVQETTDKVFEVGDRVMLKVLPWKGDIRFRKKGKLAPRYVGLFEIRERIGLVAYRLRLPEELKPVENSDREVKRLKCSRMVVVKVHLGSKR
ncbi:hypothetical protein Tco_0370683, partial [Tanacetum coccineum]